MKKKLLIGLFWLSTINFFAQNRNEFTVGASYRYRNFENDVSKGAGIKCKNIYYFKPYKNSLFLNMELSAYNLNNSNYTFNASGSSPSSIHNNFSEHILAGAFGFGLHAESNNHKRYFNFGIAAPNFYLVSKKGETFKTEYKDGKDSAGNSIRYQTAYFQQIHQPTYFRGMVIVSSLFLEFGNRFSVSPTKYLNLKLGADNGSFYVLLGLQNKPKN